MVGDMTATGQPSILIQLPDILLEIILGYLSYNEIANLRIVSRYKVKIDFMFVLDITIYCIYY